MVQNFNEDYLHGKLSEEISYPDLKNILGDDLIHDKECFAHFDYFKDDIMGELKTRDDIIVIDGVFNYTTRAGVEKILDTLIFDAVKMGYAFQHNKKLKANNKQPKRFFMIWKCNGDYYYWEINWDKIEYYSEDHEHDWGKGQQQRSVINVKVEFIKPLSTIVL